MAVETLDKVVNPNIEVLQVDDDASILEIAKLVLQEIDNTLKVDTALSVENALTKLEKTNYDVIVSDYEMPFKNGLDFLKIIREKNPNMPFILFTGRGREEVAIQALNLGANHYINKQGSPETVYGELAYSIRVAVAKNRAEVALKLSEERFSKLIENAPYAIFISDTEGNLVNTNKAAEDLVGYKKEPYIGKNLLEIGLADEENIARAAKDMATALTGVVSGPNEYEIKRADGKVVRLEISSFLILIEGKREFVGIANDVTGKKQAQDALIENEQKFRKAFEASIDACYISMMDEGNFIDVNDAFFKIYGLTREETVGKTALELGLYAHGPGDRKKMISTLKETGFFTDLELMGRRKNGEAFPVIMSGRLGDLQGKKVIFGVIRDISQERLREQALVESEERYRSLFEAVGDYYLVLEIPANGIPIIYDANQAALTHHGYTRDELLAKPITFLDADLTPAILHKRINQIMKKGETRFEATHRRKDGQQIIIDVINKHITMRGKDFLLSVERDITERKHAEAKLRQSDAIFENSMDMFCIAGFDGYFKVLNPACSKVLGYSYEEFLSKPLTEFVLPEDREATIKIMETLDNGNAVRQFSNRNVRKDGGIIWLSWNAASLVGANGEKQIFAIGRDVTQTKKAEERVAVVNEKLRVVGKLTRHDVKNKLSSIQANAYLLKKKIGNNPELTKYLQNIESDLASAGRLFDLSSLFERIGAEEHITINVKDCFNEAAALFPNLKNVSIINDSDGLTVTADSLLRQVFYNLIDNSLKHGKQVSQIRLSYSVLPSSTLLVYSDNGVGINQDNKAMLFTEGFSTSNGTGLGLAMLRKILQVYGWSIVEEGEFGKGAKFVITIPNKLTVNS